MDLMQTAKQAKNASYVLGALSSDVKNRALAAVADALAVRADEILEANRLDLQAAQTAADAGKLKPALLARLKLDREKLNTVISGVRELIALPDPVGRVLAVTELDDGLVLRKVTCPLGVLLAIFESRPDVLPQIAALAIKSANAVILKGGEEASKTNDALARVIQNALETVPGFPAGALAVVHTRAESAELLKMDQYIDLVVPRGGSGLIRYVKENAAMPFLGHADGVCHIYVGKSARLDMAQKICVDAKTQYPAACNAAETVLIDQDWPDENKKALLHILQNAGVEIRGGEDVQKLIGPVAPAEDWHTEYGAKILSVKLVRGVLAAVAHINEYGSGHTDCILTEDENEAGVFMDLADSAGVYHNASTRFADGYRYGFGAEVGISTAKTHARGPVGLEGLSIYKYRLEGNGQIVADYTGKNAKKFTHKKREGNL